MRIFHLSGAQPLRPAFNLCRKMFVPCSNSLAGSAVAPRGTFVEVCRTDTLCLVSLSVLFSVPHFLVQIIGRLNACISTPSNGAFWTFFFSIDRVPSLPSNWARNILNYILREFSFRFGQIQGLFLCLPSSPSPPFWTLLFRFLSSSPTLIFLIVKFWSPGRPGPGSRSRTSFPISAQDGWRR